MNYEVEIKNPGFNHDTETATFTKAISNVVEVGKDSDSISFLDKDNNLIALFTTSNVISVLRKE